MTLPGWLLAGVDRVAYSIHMMNFFAPVLIAFVLDLLFGDPPNAFHPTAWMGSLIAALNRFRPRRNFALEFLYGMFIILFGVGLVSGIGFWLTNLLNGLPIPINWLVIAILLKTTFSLRGLDRAACEVQSALETNNLPEARRLLSWHLVSRNTSQLDESKVSAAVIESLAENASDGIIAPLFFYAIGGLPLALAYRFINTADAMLGYHDTEREWLGKFPARLDDLLNLIPARLTGLMVVIASALTGNDAMQAWRIMRRDARLTASPNAGVPMSAMAGALDVELEKVGYYCLGSGLRPAEVEDISGSRKILKMLTILFVCLSLALAAALT